MLNKEISIEKLILSSHLWLGLCGTACTWGTYVLLHQSVSFLYLSFVLSGTMTIYCFHEYFTLKENQKSIPSTLPLPAYLKLILAVGSIATMCLYFLLNRTNQLILLMPACMALLYVFPTYKGKRLKDFPYIKIIAIVIAWTTITFWIPVHSITGWWTEWGYKYLLFDRLLFFFALAIPFDIRDIRHDLDDALKTIPNTIGVYNSQYLALFALFLAGGFMSLGSQLISINPGIQTGLLLVYILLGILLIRIKDLPAPQFYSWFIDGVLFLYGIVILLLSK